MAVQIGDVPHDPEDLRGMRKVQVGGRGGADGTGLAVAVSPIEVGVPGTALLMLGVGSGGRPGLGCGQQRGLIVLQDQHVVPAEALADLPSALPRGVECVGGDDGHVAAAQGVGR